MTEGFIMKKDFYVYEHRRESDGVVFYVGKGCGNRAKTTSKRNKYWQNIVNKHGFTYHIIKSCLSEEEAFSLEQEIIEKYGVENLANLTGGGDGMKRPKPEVRARFSELQTKRWLNDDYRSNLVEQMRGRKASAETRAKMSNSASGKVRPESHCKALSKALRGKPKPEGYGEKISALRKGKMSGERNPSFDPSLHAFCNDLVIFIGTCWHMAEKNGIKRYNIDNLVRGKTKSHNGWSYMGRL